ncbi:hypothetical protein [Streptomyces sp. NPDC047706]|uniref:hypothetical protein n=1 Tax=Streptomyces sp. NPDC047706 TaxID=3365486 RepID=UPI0037190836
MRIGLALSELHDAEVELVRTLLRTAEHHRSAHDVHRLALDLAAWSRRSRPPARTPPTGPGPWHGRHPGRAANRLAAFDPAMAAPRPPAAPRLRMQPRRKPGILSLAVPPRPSDEPTTA